MELSGAEGIREVYLSVDGAPPVLTPLASPVRLKRGNFVNWILSPKPGVRTFSITDIAEGEMKGGYALGWNVMPALPDSLGGAGRFVTAEVRDIEGAVVVKRDFTLGSSSLPPSFAMDVRLGKPLEPKIIWKVFDEKMSELSRVEDDISHNEIHEDTTLAKLWAGDENRSAVGASRLTSPYFGIVDDVYSLLALPDDDVDATLRESLRDRGVPYLSKAEIFPLEPAKDPQMTAVNPGNADSSGRTGRSTTGALRVESLGETLRITWPRQAFKSFDLTICDVRGRVVKRVPLAEAGRAESWLWDLKDAWGARVKPGVYFLLLRIDGVAYRAVIRVAGA